MTKSPRSILRRRFCAVVLIAALAALSKDAGWARQLQVFQFPEGASPTDPVALLQKKLESGESQLRYTPERGYLASVLKELAIPVSSQMLVFSRTSLQTEAISRSTPRAVYFNDDVYVAFIPDAALLEIASTDPRYGTAFYVLGQTETKTPSFQRLEPPCTSCHGPAREDVPAPLLLMMSTETGESGEPRGAFHLTTDRSPIHERWGGWYVTGTAGNAQHMGKDIVFDTSRYLSPHSDIVALLLLAHQAEVHNRISEAAQRLRLSSAAEAVEDAVEPLVRALLFSEAAPLTAPVRGTSAFATEFAAQGPRDSRGRSLRDLDLNRRLFRYPLSYLIYSDSFRQLPAVAKQYVYRRLREVLGGKDQTEGFRHLSATDRASIQEILSATLPDWP